MIFPKSIFHLNEKKNHCPSVVFEKGDVRMTNTFAPDFSSGAVYLKNDEPIEIGALAPANENPPDMIWVFNNIKSLDSVIMQLQELKYSLENKTLFHPKD
jgi:hypothetical protein